MFTITILCGLAVANGPAAIVEPRGFDSPAVSAAIQRAAPGDTVRLPEGTFTLTEPIRPKSGIKLLGAGEEKTRLVYKGDQAGA